MPHLKYTHTVCIHWTSAQHKHITHYWLTNETDSLSNKSVWYWGAYTVSYLANLTLFFNTSLCLYHFQTVLHYDVKFSLYRTHAKFKASLYHSLYQLTQNGLRYLMQDDHHPRHARCCCYHIHLQNLYLTME